MFERNEMLISRITTALVLSILLLVIGMQAHQPTVVAAQPKSVARFATGFTDQFSVFNTNWAATSGSWNISTGFLRGVATANKSFSQAYFAQAQYENQDFQVRMRRTGCGTCANGILCGRRRTAPFDSSTQIAASMRLKNVEHRAARSSSHLHPILQS